MCIYMYKYMYIYIHIYINIRTYVYFHEQDISKPLLDCSSSVRRNVIPKLACFVSDDVLISAHGRHPPHHHLLMALFYGAPFLW